MDRRGIDLIREKFKELADRYNPQDLKEKGVRAIATGGKATVDKGLEEAPQQSISNFIDDLYGTLTSQEVTDGLSINAQAFDEGEIKNFLDNAVERLKTPEVSEKLAKQLKDALQKISNDDLYGAMEQAVEKQDPGKQMIARIFFQQAAPYLDQIRSGDPANTAEVLRELADNLPTDAIAEQAGALTREITPERVAKQMHDIVGKLPSPQAVAGIVHGIGKAASDTFGQIANDGNAFSARQALSGFQIAAAEIVQEKLAEDRQNKTTFNKKGPQDFDL
ncbi:MAG: hypothetical protein OXT65_08645 [Alphaproteobacteria bacterium]|nr:hypothetical protein [Alphaproteobacteria bacterium]